MRRRRRGKPRARAAAPPARKPTAEDFTSRAVMTAVRSETAQHPATIFPAAGAALTGLWGLAFGFTPATLAVALGFGFAGAASWIVNYFFRGEAFARQHIERLRTLRAQGELRDAEELEAKCRAIGFDDGAKEAAELCRAYQGLCQFLANKEGGSHNLNVERFRILAEDTYREGLGLLRKSVEIFEALEAVDVETLERELRQWKKQRAEARADNPEALDQLVGGHEERIKAHRASQQRLQQVIAELNKLEAALEAARLQTSDLMGGDALAGTFEPGEAAAQLAASIEAARRVEQWMHPDSDRAREEQRYLDAAEGVQERPPQ